MFYGVGVGLVCFGAFLPMVLLYYLFFRSRNCLRKILLMSGPVFLGCFLSSFGFFRRRRRLFRVCFFLFKRESSGSNRSHPHTHLCFCPFCVSAATGFISRFGRASFPSGVLSGCHSGPRAFFGFSRDFSEAFFSDTRRQGCFFASRACVVFPLFVLFCGFTPFLEARVGFLAEVGSPSRLFQPKWAERVVRARPPLNFWDFDGLF